MAQLTMAMFTAALSLAACGTAPDGGTAAASVRATPVANGTVPDVPVAEAAPTEAVRADFSAFWTSFRTAALAGDAAALGRLNAPTVRQRGELDDDPVETVAARDVPPRLATLLADPSPIDASGRSLRQTLASDRAPPPLADEPTNLRRVGPLVFGKTKLGWRLTEIYLGGGE